MEAVFIRILNMSLTAGILIPVVCLLRFFLRKAPKWISCLLWAVVAVRLLCPLSIESVLSLIPSAEPVPPSIAEQTHPEIHTGIAFVNDTVNPVLSETFAPEPGDSANPLQVYSFVAAVLWIAGMVILLMYALASYLILRYRVKASISWDGTACRRREIRICDDIQTPFILGVFRPCIYIPSGVEEAQIEHVIAHEDAHLRRLDHLWKPLGYIALVIHWFNPLVWIAYILLCRDIELACDEKVIQNLERKDSIAYTKSLLSCSVDRRNILICPLAFGEVGVKERISHVLHYRKPAVWIGVAAVLVCAATAVCFLTDPKREDDGTAETIPGNDEVVLSETGEVLSLTSHPEQIANGGFAADKTEDAAVQAEIEQAKKELEEKGLLESGPDRDQKAKTLDEAVIRAIMLDAAAHTPSGENAPHRAASFIKLGEETAKEGRAELITVYGVAMSMEAEFSKEAWKGVQVVSASHTPAAITVSAQDGTYQWQEYWTPKDGSYYADSIREKFPEEIAELAMDTQKFVYPNTMNCYAQFLSEGVGNVFGVIGRDLDLLCTADTSSNPQDYIDHAIAEYRDMIYYGERTLAYRDKFRADFDGLRAEILDRACAEIEEVMASGYYKKIESPTESSAAGGADTDAADGQQEEAPALQAQSQMAPDDREYENMGVDYVEQNGQYVVEGDMVLQYKKVLKGRDPNAAKALVFVVLTNDPDVTWEQVFKSVISSNSADWLPGTIIIGMKAVDD